jgi:hypothetical protein
MTAARAIAPYLEMARFRMIRRTRMATDKMTASLKAWRLKKVISSMWRLHSHIALLLDEEA